MRTIEQIHKDLKKARKEFLNYHQQCHGKSGEREGSYYDLHGKLKSRKAEELRRDKLGITNPFNKLTEEERKAWFNYADSINFYDRWAWEETEYCKKKDALSDVYGAFRREMLARLMYDAVMNEDTNLYSLQEYLDGYSGKRLFNIDTKKLYPH